MESPRKLITLFAALWAVPTLAVDVPIRGVNLSGYEYNGSKGGARQWFDYATPTAAEFTYFAGKNLKLIRIPMAWERIQPTPMGPLDPAQVAIIKAFLASAGAAGDRVILDLHNYGRYRSVIATPAQMADVWAKLATITKGSPGLDGYGLMNEPHDMGGAWPAMAQAAVDAVRKVDTTANLYVANNDGWSNIASPITAVKDPSGKVYAEGHLYFDRYNTGQYVKAWKPKTAATIMGQIANFATRAKAASMKPLIGETGGPSDVPSLALLDAELGEAAKDGVAVTYWLAGAWSGNDLSTVEPKNGADKPQMAVLAKPR